MLIISEHVLKHELLPLKRQLSLQDIMVAARKVIQGLGILVKAPVKVSGFSFIKIRVGKQHQARMMVFMVNGNQNITPILIRLKKDKIFGQNMAINNPAVRAVLNQNFDKISDDRVNGRYQEFEL